MKETSLPILTIWQLSAVLGSAMGFPAMLIGGVLSNSHGAGSAIVAILLGNVILWVAGLGIISMSAKKNHAIENIKNYLGKPVGMFVSLLILLAFLTWFVIQLKGATVIGLKFESSLKEFSSWKIGLLLGFLISICSLWGIRFIGKFCTAALPVLVLFSFILVKVTASPVVLRGTWGVPIVGILTIVFSWLPGMVNLPTFLRHSISKADSFLVLTLITVYHAFFQIISVLAGLGNSIKVEDLILSENSSLFLLYIISFIILFCFCINLVNIYFASAAFDLFFPLLQGAKKYFIIGLIGTSIYVGMEVLSPTFSTSLNKIEQTITSFISNLGIVLLVEYLISMVVQHRPRFYEKFWTSISWLLGCFSVLLVELGIVSSKLSGPLAGIVTSILVFTLILFIEESLYSFKNLDNPNDKFYQD